MDLSGGEAIHGLMSLGFAPKTEASCPATCYPDYMPHDQLMPTAVQPCLSAAMSSPVESALEVVGKWTLTPTPSPVLAASCP